MTRTFAAAFATTLALTAALPATAQGIPTLACDFGEAGTLVLRPAGAVAGAVTLQPDTAVTVSRAEDGMLWGTRVAGDTPVQIALGPDGAAWLTDWFGPTGARAVAGTCAPA